MKTKTITSLGALLLPLALLPALGCGDDDNDNDNDKGGGSCSAAFQPCGGDVVGSWEGSSLCFGEETEQTFKAAFEESLGMTTACKDAFQSMNFAPKNMSATFTSTQATLTGGLETTFKLRVTEGCFESLSDVNGITLNQELCDVFEESLKDSEDDPEPAFQSVSCTFGSKACNCELKGTEDLTSSAGYKVMGNTLVSDEDGEATPYCVSGNTLRMQQTDAESMLSGALVFTKK